MPANGFSTRQNRANATAYDYEEENKMHDEKAKIKVNEIKAIVQDDPNQYGVDQVR